MSKANPPFWEIKSLAEMNHQEWESLCDGCAQCCLIKFENLEKSKLAVTPVACSLLDLESCSCTRYEERHDLIEDCIELEAGNIKDLYWLPETCAYRLIAEGKPLFDWHPLISGEPSSVRKAGVSIYGKAMSEKDIHMDDLEAHFLKWVK